jgi:hypothetical protein
MSDDDNELPIYFSRCFQSEDGDRVLRHLRAITVLRVLGPNSSDSLLRYVEGQRQLVKYIDTLIRRGRGSQP